MNATRKSQFVTVVAWIFIVLSGFGTLISLMQNIMIQTMFNDAGMEQAMQARQQGVPALAGFMLGHFKLFFAAFFLVSALTLVSSIGLLKRWNWARLLFIGLMALGIVWNLFGLVLQWSMFASIRESFAPLPNQPDAGMFLVGIGVMSLVFALGFSFLFGWIIKRLASREVVAEFKAAR